MGRCGEPHGSPCELADDAAAAAGSTSRESRGTGAFGSEGSISSVAGRSRVSTAPCATWVTGVASVFGPAETMSGKSRLAVSGPTVGTSAVSRSPGTRTGVRRLAPGFTPG
jgi:hypothetical protein